MEGLGFNDWTWTGFSEHNVGVVTQLHFFVFVSEKGTSTKAKKKATVGCAHLIIMEAAQMQTVNLIHVTTPHINRYISIHLQISVQKIAMLQKLRRAPNATQVYCA
jgi:hypothetical protein